MVDHAYSEQVTGFAAAPSLDQLPAVVDVGTTAPLNPPEAIQLKFNGLSYHEAYDEAESFVTAADGFAAKYGRGGLSAMDRILDFGSGWGRLTRTLLLHSAPERLYAVDVDAQMTALVNTTLPGVNALTISPDPPTVLADGSMDAAVAFSVFSHLSGPAHEAWAKEIGRIISPDGVVAITVLDHAFFAQIAGAQAAVAAGHADNFAASLAPTFPDLAAAQRGYRRGKIQFVGTGGGEVRSTDYYGWAAAPPKYVMRVWGAAGLHVVEWIPSGVLFGQALVFLTAQPGPPPRSLNRAHLAVAHMTGALRRRMRGRG